MWTYKQETGEILHNGVHVAFGYSGHAAGKNNPADQNQRGVGPIPQGDWIISGPPMDTDAHGPFVLHLFPKMGTVTFDRSAFLMHGDSVVHPGQASLGCVIMPRAIREQVWNSGDRELHVVAN